MRILISACLVGRSCTYEGTDNCRDDLTAALAGHEFVPVCPEVAGGLGVPRPRCEIAGGRVVDAAGVDHTDAYRFGARAAVMTAASERVDIAVLADRSPSCGVAGVYDGTFTKTIDPTGRGVTAAALMDAGVECVGAGDAIAMAKFRWS